VYDPQLVEAVDPLGGREYTGVGFLLRSLPGQFSMEEAAEL